MSADCVDYHGKPVERRQYEALIALEQLLGKPLPIASPKDSNYVFSGVVIRDEEVIALGIMKRNLSRLPENFGNLSSLEILHLPENTLSGLPDCIGNLSTLTYLNLRNNRLSSLPDTFGNLSTLTGFSLDKNLFTFLPEIIGKLPALLRLSVSENQLTELPEIIGNIQTLKGLTLSYNQLTSLPPSFARLSKLENLQLENNRFSTLPEMIGQLSAITELNAAHNLLSSLPASIGNLHALKTLVVAYNRITSLPDNIGNLHSLEKLDLSYNNLSTLPESVTALKSLTRLFLSSNCLTTLQKDIAKLEKLTQLKVDYNKLTTLPVSISNLPSLKEISISHNPLPSIPESFAKFPESVFWDYIVSKKRFEKRTEGVIFDRNLFWEILLTKTKVITNFGNFGKPGVSDMCKYKSIPEATDAFYSLVKQYQAMGYVETTGKFPDFGRLLKPPLHFQSKAKFLTNLFIKPRAIDEDGVFLPIRSIDPLGSCTIATYLDCPNLPDHHVVNGDPVDVDPAVCSFGGPDYWFDVEIISGDAAIFPLRLTFSLGDPDSNDGFWGAFWDRTTKEIVANIISTGDCETTLEVVADAFLEKYKPHGRAFAPFFVPDPSYADGDHLFYKSPVTGSNASLFELEQYHDSWKILAAHTLELENLLVLALRFCILHVYCAKEEKVEVAPAAPIPSRPGLQEFEKSLGESFASLQARKPKQLKLMYKGLTSLPEAIGTLTSLTELRLKGNKLTSLPVPISESVPICLQN